MSNAIAEWVNPDTNPPQGYERPAPLAGLMRETMANVRRSGFDVAPPVPTMVALMHSEVSELLEAWRKGKLNEPSDHADAMTAAGCPVMTCAAEEIADVIIRALNAAYALGVDPDRAVHEKMAFNATRTYRHGGKAA